MQPDPRMGLHRRFTTNALPTLSPIGQQRRQAAGDYGPVSQSAKNQGEKKEDTEQEEVDAVMNEADHSGRLL
ncbi:hypothetical protein K431DRAFT_284234 [Polychaeton citri CBS 116435]|uniref:Uncharacterized protein n=1 Tax=Polychaeton citri CBS 116435 TaxID=1314669 RepID=A0A9P4URF8_9PEZI|nr:hypothetical protein K431DRAFT_284234 [Polychaeton citri CBS 116435]